MQPQTTTGADLERAIALCEAGFPDGHAANDYVLIRAERLLTGAPECATPRCWRLTFKLTSLVPTALPARIGAGGEVFFVADVAAGTAKVTGFGE